LGHAQAQEHLNPNPWATQSQVSIDYGPQPSDPLYSAIYGRVKQQYVLEKLQRFLALLRLARQLTVRMAQCGNNIYYRPYKPGGDVTICYEFVKQVEDLAPPEGSNGIVGVTLVSREATITGPIVEEALHDVALAVFDNLQIPVWGRPEDAADNVAALSCCSSARALQKKRSWVRHISCMSREQTHSTTDYVADVRPPVRQRYYNILCVAYGADPVKFSALQAYNRNELQMDLPRDRASDCALRFAGAQHQNTYEGEYEKLTAAFKTLILGPYTDPELLKKLLVVDPLKYP
jgi:hypothetical protein